jgi:polygalacturonase
LGPYKSALILAVLAAATARAQDTRRVVEPVFPAACTELRAELTAVDGNKTLAAADEAKLDTVRIQKALDRCAKGQSVVLKADGARNAFLTGPLDLRSGVTLRVDAGVILFGSRDPKIYEVRPGSCGLVAEDGRGCRAMINGNDAPDAGVMGPGTIDGRGGARLLGKNITWWDIAEEARGSGHQNVPRILVLSRCNNFTLYRVTLKNSANFHVYYGQADGFTAWGVVINTPKNARNTDGIDPAAAKNVTIAHCFINTGDDNVAIKAGGHVSNMTIAHNHFYTGHGMSIGSETQGGAEAILVEDLSIDGADNGIRIKSNATRGGLVRNVVYRDVCIRNTKNPIFMDSDYEHAGKAGGRMPRFTDVELHDVRIEDGGKVTLQGFDEEHRLGMVFDNVVFDASPKLKLTSEHAELTFGPGPVNIQPTGPDVRVTGRAGKGSPNACVGKFAEMPEKPAGLR